jgi:hypothetical protein
MGKREGLKRHQTVSHIGQSLTNSCRSQASDRWIEYMEALLNPDPFMIQMITFLSAIDDELDEEA